MTTETLTTRATPLQPTLIRRRLLRVHGTLLTFVALASAAYSTIARATGIGPYGFLQQNPMVWVGLVQAYLLMAVIALVLLMGSGQAHVRQWHVIAALAHSAPWVAVVFAWDLLGSLGFGPIAVISLVFHSVWIAIESIAALYPDPAR